MNNGVRYGLSFERPTKNVEPSDFVFSALNRIVSKAIKTAEYPSVTIEDHQIVLNFLISKSNKDQHEIVLSALGRLYNKASKITESIDETNTDYGILFRAYSGQ